MSLSTSLKLPGLRPLGLSLLLMGGVHCAGAAPAPKSLPPSVEKQLRQLLLDPAMQSGHLGVAVMALGKVSDPAQYPAVPYDHGARPLLFAVDERKRFLPASNMKLFTAAWVLHRLGPERFFTTRVLVGMRPPPGWPKDATGKTVLVKTAIIAGDGDPSLTTADLQALAKQLVAGGVQVSQTAVDGSILNGESMGGRYPDGWTLDDTLWDYGAPVTGLAINRNAVQLKLTGPAAVGSMPHVDATPENPLKWRISVQGVGPEGVQSIHVDRELYGVTRELEFKYAHFRDSLNPMRFDGEWEPSVLVSGTIRVGGTDEEDIAVTNPEAWAAQIFRAALTSSADSGSEATSTLSPLTAAGLGATTAVAGPPPAFAPPVAPPLASRLAASTRQGSAGWVGSAPQPMAAHNSLPLKTLLAQFLKPSDNLYGEMLLRRAAVELPPDAAEGSEHKAVGGTYIASTGLAGRAHADMVRWLLEQGVRTEGLRFSDGSGLSRYNLVTPLAVAQLLGVAQDIPGSNAFYEALPIAGVDGTLKKRMKGTPAEANVHAKTGTFSIANCLSGYVTTRDGNRLAVSILTDFEPDGEAARVWQGKVFAVLAGSGG